MNQRHTLRAALLISLLLWVTGCHVHAPSQNQPDFRFDIPDQWTGDPENGTHEHRPWWESFQDEQLAFIIEEALANNYDLAFAASRLDIAAAQATIAGVDLSPQVSAGRGVSRQRTNIPASGVAGSGTRAAYTTNYGVSLDVSWELDLWGRVRSGAEASLAEYQATESDLVSAKLSIAAQSAKAWFALIESNQQVALARETVENFESTARQASDRVSAGVQPASDMHLAQSNLATARSTLQQRELTLDAIRRQLEILLGRYPASRFESSLQLPALPSTPATGLPSELIQRRPDVVYAERALAATLSRIDAAKAAFYPRISLNASGGVSSDGFSDLLDADRIVWNIAGNIVQPIFEGGRLKAQVRLAEGRYNERVAVFAQTVLDAFGVVETALYAEHLLAQREEYLVDATNHARSAVSVSQNRYRQGIESFIVVLESQRRALDAESGLISVRRQRLENRVDLYLALGGGFEGELPQIPVAIVPTEQLGQEGSK